MKKFVASLIVGAFLLCPVGGVPTQTDDSASVSFIKVAEAKRSYKGEFHKPRIKKGAHKPSYNKPSYNKPSHKPKYKKVKVKGYRKKNGHYVKPHTRHVRMR